MTAAMKSEDISFLTKSYDKPRQSLLCWQRSYCQGYGLPSGHVRLWELDHKEGGVPENWCLQTVVLEKTPESPMDSKIKPVKLKGNQPWILLGRTDAEVETPVFSSSDVNSWLTGKVPNAGKDLMEKSTSEDEMGG